jgi:transcriptional regulator with XRE-family HTH domain
MLGTELPEWRKRNRFTQDTLRIALGVKSRQTIITWEKSQEPLSKLVRLALLALERIPEARLADGYRFPNAQAVHKHVWAEREYPGRKEPTPLEECGSQESR